MLTDDTRRHGLLTRGLISTILLALLLPLLAPLIVGAVAGQVIVRLSPLAGRALDRATHGRRSSPAARADG